MKIIVRYALILCSIGSLHAKKINTTVKLDIAEKAHVSAAVFFPQAITLLEKVKNLENQHTNIIKGVDQNSPDRKTPIETLKELQAFEKELKTTIASIQAFKKNAAKTTELIPPISFTQERAILYNELNPITKEINRAIKQKKPLDYSLIKQQELLQEQIKQLDSYIQAQKQAAKKAAKNYIILCNKITDVGERLHIYAAPKVNPNAWSKKPIKTIKASKTIALLACDPKLVYKIEIRKKHPKLRKGKFVYEYHSLNRSGSKEKTFSSDDNGHQLIVTNYHQYSVHSMEYEGKGSVKQQKVEDIAVLVTITVVLVLATIATFGAMAAFDAPLMAAGLTFAGTTTTTTGATTATTMGVGAALYNTSVYIPIIATYATAADIAVAAGVATAVGSSAALATENEKQNNVENEKTISLDNKANNPDTYPAEPPVASPITEPLK